MKKVFLYVLLVALVAGLIFGGCAKSTPPTSGPQEILLGAVEPLTGNLATFGQDGTFGVQAAVDDINGQGGVFVKEYNRKLPVKLIVIDDQSDTTKAATLAESLVLQDKVHFLIGGTIAPPEFAGIATVADKYRIPFISHEGPFEPYTAMRATASPPWQYTWALGFHIGAPFAPGDFRYNVPGYSVIDVMSAVLKQVADQTNKRTAVFASDEPDGRGWYASMPAGLKGMGLDVFGADKELGLAPPNTTDFSAIIKQWKDYNCELLIGNSLSPWFGTLWRQSREMGFKPKFVYAGRASNFYTDIKAWGGDLAWGVGCETTWDTTIKGVKGIGNTTPVTLNDRYMKGTGNPFSMLVGLGYYAAQVLFDSIERAGTLDKDKVNEALAQTDMMTIYSRVVFDENHFSGGPVAYAQWFKVNTPAILEQRVVMSLVDFWPTADKVIFPIP